MTPVYLCKIPKFLKNILQNKVIEIFVHSHIEAGKISMDVSSPGYM
jgi:hypothetical protein